MYSNFYHYQHISLTLVSYVQPLLCRLYFSKASPRHHIISFIIYQNVSLESTLKA